MRTCLLLGLVLVGCARINYGVPDGEADDDGNGDTDQLEQAFDFSGSAIPTGIDFSRGSAATFIDGGGVLQTVTSNVPRFVGNALLLEGERFNLLANTRFEAGLAPWELDNTTTANVHVVAGGLLGDGGHHLELRRDDGEPNQGFVQLVPTLTDEAHTVSFVARGVGDCAIDVAVDGLFVGEPIALDATARRYTRTFTPTDGDQVYIGFFCRDAAVGAGFDISHIQLEAGPIATSIIINDGINGTARRAPDRLVAIVSHSDTPTVAFRGRVDAIADRSCLACLTNIGGDPAFLLDAEPSAPEVGFVTYSARSADARVDLDDVVGDPVSTLASSDGFDLLLARDGVTAAEDRLGTAATFDRLVVGVLNTDLPFDAVLRVERVVYSTRPTDEPTASTLTSP